MMIGRLEQPDSQRTAFDDKSNREAKILCSLSI